MNRAVLGAFALALCAVTILLARESREGIATPSATHDATATASSSSSSSSEMQVAAADESARNVPSVAPGGRVQERSPLDDVPRAGRTEQDVAASLAPRPLTGEEVPYEHATPEVQTSIDVASLEVEALVLDRQGDRPGAARAREERDLAVAERDSRRAAGDGGR